jgi:serine/threonine-protein kinase
MAELPPSIGRYVVDDVLGRGAMGVVYKAHDPEIDRAVAIKLVRGELLEGPQGEIYLARFRQEVKAAGRCLHPNIVTIYDFGLHADGPFFVMEYVDGRPLDATLKGLALPPSTAGALGLQLLSALACAHGLGVVHRDVKPANLLLTRDHTLKVLDFGISGLPTSHLTQAGAVMGTPSYMSPEQFRGETSDARSDIFAAGVVLFELLTGRTPFPGRSFEEVMVKLLYSEGLELAGDAPPVPEPLRPVLATALARAPHDRFASAAAMAEALRAALARIPDAGPVADATVIAPRPQPTAPAAGAAAAASAAAPDAATLATIERRLAQHIGPIAGRLLRQAQRQAASLDELCERLADNIDAAPERTEFLRDVRAVLRDRAGAAPDAGERTGGDSPAASLGAAELEALRAELVRYLGPIAAVLIRRAAPGARSLTELRIRVAEQIDDPQDRARFLAGR